MNAGVHAARTGRRAALLLVVAAAACLASSTAGAALGERYIDPANGFSIRPPRGWEVLPNPAAGVSVAFRGPREGDFAPSINVAVLPTPLEITPQALRRTVDDLQAQFAGTSPPLAKDLAEQVPVISNYRVINARIVTLYDGNAGFLESAYDEGAGDARKRLRNFQVMAPGAGCHYVLTYTAPADRYEATLKEAHESVNSFAGGAAPAGSGPRRKRWTDYGPQVGTVLGWVIVVWIFVFMWRRAKRRRRR